MNLDELQVPAWHYEAACNGHDSSFWFADRASGGEAQALLNEGRRICLTCPVLRECLEAAMAAEGCLPHNMRAGIWGGLSGAERWALYRRRVNAERAAREAEKAAAGGA
ncbi:WhiB family transcriptional regulator [Streptomyces sp. DSM 42041]|uniref:WhiB family transcriptional regulator n=1 Tax=Streptomyces hazeniae TaxID=3075538 RepID=A0ABU2NJY9_9ACTN|nr:WhiB family transcriptional regulator [Streptomyces sp. DSM 42041]MDT0377310.1 WhiB family transcriptional regulator [Streptomyces sp. DSM 42041]